MTTADNSDDLQGDATESDYQPTRRRFVHGLIIGTAAVGVGTACSGSDETPPIAGQITTNTSVQTPVPQAPASSTQTATTQTTTQAEVTVPSTPAEARRVQALQVRAQATELANSLDIVEYETSAEELASTGYAMSFTKGLPHDYETGLVARTADFEQFVAAIDEATPEAFEATPLGPDGGRFQGAPSDSLLRGWESPSVGATFALVGPDPQAFVMPPPPPAGSAELTGEMAELYAQSLLRDVPFRELQSDGTPSEATNRAIDSLNSFEWFDGSSTPSGLDAAAQARRRTDLNLQTAFRGIAPGDTTGPYISQLLLAGSALPDGSQTESDGLLVYGAQNIDQRVRQADPVDFMTTWDDWFDVQNALRPSELEIYSGPRRFITTPRDLATYVHIDALYQSYLNACLVLLGKGTPFDPGMPFRELDAIDHQQGFALFGIPHVLSMLVEVCSRALRSAMFQKFYVHRRLRPEALAARIEKADDIGMEELVAMRSLLEDSTIGQDTLAVSAERTGTASMLLPMAFVEGSPMHPSYGAGHATIAGACTTVLKALFNHTHPMDVTGSVFNAFVPNADGSALDVVPVFDRDGEPAGLTVEGELNKLAANIAIGRNWAGVHYFTDYWESVLLGQSVAIEILREHLLTYPGKLSLTVPTFQGESIRLER